MKREQKKNPSRNVKSDFCCSTVLVTPFALEGPYYYSQGITNQWGLGNIQLINYVRFLFCACLFLFICFLVSLLININFKSCHQFSGEYILRERDKNEKKNEKQTAKKRNKCNDEL